MSRKILVLLILGIFLLTGCGTTSSGTGGGGGGGGGSSSTVTVTGTFGASNASLMSKFKQFFAGVFCSPAAALNKNNVNKGIVFSADGYSLFDVANDAFSFSAPAGKAVGVVFLDVTNAYLGHLVLDTGIDSLPLNKLSGGNSLDLGTLSSSGTTVTPNIASVKTALLLTDGNENTVLGETDDYMAAMYTAENIAALMDDNKPKFWPKFNYHIDAGINYTAASPNSYGGSTYTAKKGGTPVNGGGGATPYIQCFSFGLKAMVKEGVSLASTENVRLTTTPALGDIYDRQGTSYSPPKGYTGEANPRGQAQFLYQDPSASNRGIYAFYFVGNMPAPIKDPPDAATYIINYNNEFIATYNIPDQRAADDDYVLIRPVVVCDTSGTIKEINWTFGDKGSDSRYSSVPPAVVSNILLEILDNVTSNTQLIYSTELMNKNTTSHTMFGTNVASDKRWWKDENITSVNWTNVGSIYMSYEDYYGNNFFGQWWTYDPTI
ncbi:MAG: hypothetical protein KKA19_00195 [Candidatus Margulisbacteria bacterium]|nr:hypothetical protein [Candidatus Margulisiibacteriota bacterium]